MNLRMDETLATFLREVRQAAPDQKVYLVGGAVRDLVLGRGVKDLDFVVADGSVQLAKAVRRRFKGVWYTLDDEHQTARVILKQGQPGELILDFTAFIGGSLEEDLRQRDFSINAMAIDLDNLSMAIDPLGGQDDLISGNLRLCNPQSLLSDPLRTIRAVRMTRTFNLDTGLEIINELRVASKSLYRISGERIRDELLKCLAMPDLALTYVLLKEYGILDQLLYRIFKPESSNQFLEENFVENSSDIDEFFEEDHLPTRQVLGKETKVERNFLKTLETLMLHIESENPDSIIPERCPVCLSIPDILQGLNLFLRETLQGGRTRKQLLILFAMFFSDLSFHPSSDPEMSPLGCLEFAERFTNTFMLGQKEHQFYEAVCIGYRNIFSLHQETKVDALQIYRYFKQVGSCGVVSALLHIVNYCASTSTMEEKNSLVEAIIFTWFREQATIVDPPSHVDGDDLQKILHLNPGPDLGFYLESIREAQVEGKVKNRDEALALVSQLVKEGKYHDR